MLTGGMAGVALVTLLLLVQYYVFAILVGRARMKAGVKAPATVGDEHFERCHRVQQNTLEQLMVVLPAMWIFAVYVNAPLAALLGVVFMVGRTVYCRDYLADPARRGRGFAIGQLPQVILVLGGLGGTLAALF